MSKKKLVVLGRGTAGAQALAHFHRWMPDCEVEWHFDPNIPPQAVGEGSLISLPRNLNTSLGFSHRDLKEIDGTFKIGIYKEGWGKNGTEFFHDFVPSDVAYHFNAVRLQNFVFDKLKDKVKVVECNTTAQDIDADFIMDCSGRPTNYDAFNMSEHIAVNSVHVNQCFWDYPRFQYTLNIARPYGWVFGIPLANRCSIGYMYNNNINTLEEVKEDMKYIFEKYDLTPSDTTNSFSFNSYTRKQNYEGRIAYNGNASFFLEPLEATSLGVMDEIQRNAFDVWTGAKSIDAAEASYQLFLKEIEVFLMMHYLDGSKFQTKFWDFAKERAEKCFANINQDKRFVDAYKKSRNVKTVLDCFEIDNVYGQWWSYSFFQNISGMGLHDKLDMYTKTQGGLTYVVSNASVNSITNTSHGGSIRTFFN